MWQTVQFPGFGEAVPSAATSALPASTLASNFSVVCFVSLARHGEHLETVYDTAVVLRGDPEDLMHKAVGWMLREAGRTDPPRLETFLLRHGPTLPRTTLRYAIERFDAPSRKRLLAQTRGGGAQVTISS